MRSIPIIAVALALSACATSNPNVVPVYQAQRVSHVYDATVLRLVHRDDIGIRSRAGAERKRDGDDRDASHGAPCQSLHDQPVFAVELTTAAALRFRRRESLRKEL